MNIYDIILAVFITAALLFAVRSAVRHRRKGGCCGDCSECSRGKSCSGIK